MFNSFTLADAGVLPASARVKELVVTDTNTLTTSSPKQKERSGIMRLRWRSKPKKHKVNVC